MPDRSALRLAVQTMTLALVLATGARAQGSGEVTLISRSAPGSPVATPNGPSTAAALSRDGNIVLFLSRANGLVPGQVDNDSGLGDQLGSWDVFLRDRKAGKTFLLSRYDDGAYKAEAVGGQEPALSADGRFAAFVTIEELVTSPPSTSWRLLLYDRTTDTRTLVNHVPGSADTEDGGAVFQPTLSADGRYLAFACERCGLIPGHPANRSEIFLYDRVTGALTLATPATGGNDFSLEPRISADGRFVAFRSYATNLIPGQTDVPGTSDLFLFDRTTGGLTLVSHAPGSATAARGDVLSVGLSGDGNFIAFTSNSDILVPGQVDVNGLPDLFLYDRASGTNVLVSHAASSPLTAGNGSSLSSFADVALSADGRFLAFASAATDLLPEIDDTNDTFDVFLYDRVTGTTQLLSTAPRGGTADGGAARPALSADGSRVAFVSQGNLFVLDRPSDTTTLVGRVHSAAPVTTNPPISFEPRLSENGRFVAFTSDSDQFVSGDSNANWDAYLFDSGPLGSVPLQPCRLLDTRRRAERPVLTSNVRRDLPVFGRCGVPATAKQIVVKVTVFNPSGKGNLRFYPGAVTTAPSGILRFERGAILTESFILPLGTNGALTLLPFVAGKGRVHAAVEVNGYLE
jgi:Tol biopolymer transport system component